MDLKPSDDKIPSICCSNKEADEIKENIDALLSNTTSILHCIHKKSINNNNKNNVDEKINPVIGTEIEHLEDIKEEEITKDVQTHQINPVDVTIATPVLNTETKRHHLQNFLATHSLCKIKLKWQKKSLQQPLLNISKEYSYFAIECFECILRYCGDVNMDPALCEVKCVYTILMVKLKFFIIVENLLSLSNIDIHVEYKI